MDLREAAELAEPYVVDNEATKGGTPCIRGTRMTVYSVLGRVDRGDTINAITEGNPTFRGRPRGLLSSARGPIR